MKGLVPLLEAAGQAAHRAGHRAGGHRQSPPPTAGWPRPSSDSTWPPSCAASPASPTTSWPATTPRPRWRWCPRCTRGSRCPAIEAMACGVPLVATTGGALPEVVGDRRRVTGLLVRAGRSRAPWPRAIAPPARRRRPAAGGSAAAGRERVLGRFTWQVTAAGTAAQYRALLDDVPGATRRCRPDAATAVTVTAAPGRADRRLRPTRRAPRRPPARPGVRFRPTRLPGGAARGRGGGLRCRGRRGPARSSTPSAPWPSTASWTSRRAPGGRRCRATPCALPFADGSLRPGHRLRGPRAHPRRRAGHGRAGPGAPTRGHHGRDRAPVRPGVRQLGPVRRVPQRARRPRPDLPAASSWSGAWRPPGCGPPAATTPTGSTPPTGGCGAWSDRRNDSHPAVSAYHRLLVWDIERRPRSRAYADRVLNPLVGKSLVVYLEKPQGRPTHRLRRPAGRCAGGVRGGVVGADREAVA